MRKQKLGRPIAAMPAAVLAGAALAVLLLAAAPAAASSVCGDVDDSGTVNASDALSVLRFAVGQAVELLCAPPGGLPSTNQTTCYDSAGVQVDCAGSGQDGDFRKGVARSFTDNGDGTVTDHATGLMWEKLSDDGSIHDQDDRYAWQAAFDSKIATLNSQKFAGYDDWRLPNVIELESLRDFAVVNPAIFPVFHTGCAAGCTVLTCSCALADTYWSSSTYKINLTNAWFVYFYNGNTQANNKSFQLAVRAVRDAS